MTVKVRDAGGLATISAIKVRTADGLKTLSQLSIRDADGLHSLLTAMEVTAAPTTTYGYGSSGVAIRITTNACTATVVGGYAPFTYAWEAADTGWDAVSPSSPSTLFRSPPVNAGADAFTIFTCTVTDAGGNVVVSNNVEASVANTGY